MCTIFEAPGLADLLCGQLQRRLESLVPVWITFYRHGPLDGHHVDPGDKPGMTKGERVESMGPLEGFWSGC